MAKPSEVIIAPEIRDEDGNLPRWVDAHSVTCALCGGWADERETVNLQDIEGYPDTEAHTECYEYAEENSVEEAKEELQPLVHK